MAIDQIHYTTAHLLRIAYMVLHVKPHILLL